MVAAYIGNIPANEVIEDVILSEYINFLEVGKRYIFCTGIDYSANIKLLKTYNPFCAIELDGYSLRYHTWDKYGNYESNLKNTNGNNINSLYMFSMNVNNWKVINASDSVTHSEKYYSDQFRDTNDK